ncbi:hypothetical protein NTGBS_80016 [Candidatus Nitrotoga sp. BS]|nr:hypothetical protein NTGBS_80016 [Candidatus Nitrotoga sp. BS]
MFPDDEKAKRSFKNFAARAFAFTTAGGKDLLALQSAKTPGMNCGQPTAIHNPLAS